MASQLLMAVKIVNTVVHIQLIFLSVNGKTCARDPVGIGRDHRTEKAVIIKIFFQRVVSHHHVGTFSFLIGNDKAHEDGSKIRHHCLHSSAVFQRIEGNLFSVL